MSRKMVMASLLIRCPRTGKEVSTGIETDSANYARFPDALAYTYCPHCGLKHAWWHRDAWLDGGGSLDPAAEASGPSKETRTRT